MTASYDMQLARGVVEDGWTNLAIGEPYLLQKYLPTPFLGLSGAPPAYPPAQGDSFLLNVLKAKYPGHHVVVTNGAKQALYAALYATKYPHVAIQPPYWPSFPTIVGRMGPQWNLSRLWREPDLTQILVIPNNPDGYRPGHSRKVCDIWDAVYAHPFYGWKSDDEPFWEIKIESASKMLGLSGFRVGWLVTPHAEYAERATEYVELTTSGVSVPSQRLVARQLEMAQDGWFDLAYEKARGELLRNGQNFLKLLGQWVDDVKGVPDNGTGMFAWFKPKKPWEKPFHAGLQAAKVRVIRGEACGEGGWIRMSMGLHAEETKQALVRVQDEVWRARFED